MRLLEKIINSLRIFRMTFESFIVLVMLLMVVIPPFLEMTLEFPTIFTTYRDNLLGVEFARSYFSMALFFVGCIVLFLAMLGPVRREFIWSKCSWAYYVYWVVLLASVGCIFTVWGWSNALVALSGCLILCFFVRLSASKIDLKKDWRFAPDSVGGNKDELDFKGSAKSWAGRMLNDKEEVEVFLLDGSQGFGKSSFVRMIVESLGANPRDLLYTYVALTETNEGNDLARLFAERWGDTLSARYPKIRIDKESGMLRGIVRVSGQSFSVEDVFNFLSRLDRPITTTLAYDGATPCSRSVAKVFGCVPRIHEKVWLVVFDEIDRALPQEIYRLLEILERFKHLPQDQKLPVKLRFILCVARDDLDKLLKELKGSNDAATGHHIDKFFYLKSLHTKILLPFVPYEKRCEFILKCLKPIYYGQDEAEIWKKVNEEPHVPDPLREFQNSENSLSFAIQLLAKDSPRMAKRVISGADSKRAVFLRAGRHLHVVRFSDFLLMEYAHQKYPFLIDFMYKTIDEIVPRPMDSIRDLDLFMKKMETRKFKDKDGKELGVEEALCRWLQDETGAEEDKVKKSVPVLAALSFTYIRYLQNIKSRERYEDSFSDPWNLYRYLRLAQGKEDPAERLDAFYSRHLKSEDVLTEMSDAEEITRYVSTMLRQDTKVPDTILLGTAKEIIERIASGSTMPFEKHGGRGTPRHNATIALSEIVQRILSSSSNNVIAVNKDVENAVNLCVSFLQKAQIETGLKLILLSGLKEFPLIKDKRSQCFKDLSQAGRGVLAEFYSRYDEQQKVIYDFEENYIFVLYNVWSGDPNDEQEIAKIRTIAERGLESNPEAIKAFWGIYSTLMEDKRVGPDVVSRNKIYPNTESTAFFITLDRLNEVTNNGIENDPVFLKKVAKINDLLKKPELESLKNIYEDRGTTANFIKNSL